MAKCTQCGNSVPAYYISGGLCDGCKWDTWIPPGYQKKEKCEMDPGWGHANATRRPLLGVEFLDHHNHVWETIAACRRKPKL